MNMPAQLQKGVLFTLRLFILMGCNSSVQSLKDDAEVIQATDVELGYLLIGVETYANLKTII
jgi:hypothetical protein